ncbi:hypothetical protein cyc_00209 [Cyclospora cayetanensis]|uniref:Uncharacterized protein n=1 Tax=Cyclospora cayetanensis TaxID=88456 RepID=A0A1D3D696_9EIME|nr:hypothetical protein cyc_00209 [Cyclospora cayetanensis]
MLCGNSIVLNVIVGSVRASGFPAATRTYDGLEENDGQGRGMIEQRFDLPAWGSVGADVYWASSKAMTPKG